MKKFAPVFFCLALFLTPAIGFGKDSAPQRKIAQAPLSPSETQIHTGEKYPTISMGKSNIGEDKPGFQGKHGTVHYFTAEEREQHRVIIQGGFVYDHEGNPYQAPPNRLNYVMDAAGNFYFFNQVGHTEIRHSSVFDGAPVAGAGEIMVVEGRVTQINRDSGHYDPSPKILKQVMVELEADGVDLARVRELPKH